MQSAPTLPILDEATFNGARREQLSDYDRYLNDSAKEYADTIDFVSGNLADPEYLKSSPPALLARVSGALASDSLAFLHLIFSAGDSVHRLASFFPSVIERWERFAEFDTRFQSSPEHHGAVIAHASLKDDFGYFDALRLLCFAYLLGHANLVPRIARLLERGNQERDGLVERLLQPYGLAVDPLPSDSLRQLPYRNTLKLFEAETSDRPALMAKYLDKWYVASRRESYYDTHKGTAVFLGYWSFESAALTYMLGIDDTSFRDHQFYPRELVEFARSLPRPAVLGGATDAYDANRLRCLAGQACPRSGLWRSPGPRGASRRFESGETMPDVGGDYGTTIWQWDDNQTP